MSMYFRKIPDVIQNLYNKRTWTIDTTEKVIYLTFDDGPHPEITPFLLDTLSKFSAKVTFFQLGSKVLKYPELHAACKAHGHTIGNHGYDHLDALSVSSTTFVENIKKGESATQSQLYRPTYGRLPLYRRNHILTTYDVIMWDVMSGDFDPNLSTTDHLDGILTHLQSGSILVMHENDKAQNKLIHSLSKILSHYTHRGYSFRGLKDARL